MDEGVAVIAGAAGGFHALPLLVHVHACLAAAAVHGHKVDSAGVVAVAEGAAGAATAGHVVGVLRVARAGRHVLAYTVHWGRAWMQQLGAEQDEGCT